MSLGTVAYLTQLLGTGLFHADPHPGNLIRTTDGQLAILDFGLMTEINDQQVFVWCCLKCSAQLEVPGWILRVRKKFAGKSFA